MTCTGTHGLPHYKELAVHCLIGKRRLPWQKKKRFKWGQLNNYRNELQLDDRIHFDTNADIIHSHLREACSHWREIKSQAPELRRQFLQEQAEHYAQQHNMDSDKALKAIIKAEESKCTYQNIKDITGHKKDKNPLT